MINIKEERRIRELEKKRNIKFEFGKIPNGRAICKKQLFGLVDKIVQTNVKQEEIAGYLPAVYDALEGFDKVEVIKRFVSAEFNPFLEYYRNAGDINVKTNRRKESKKASASKPVKRKKPFRGKKTQRFFISVGRPVQVQEVLEKKKQSWGAKHLFYGV